MISTERVDRVRGIKTGGFESRISSGQVARYGNTTQPRDGELLTIRILDHLGGGKVVVDLKGERVVANTPLCLEKDQEVDVIVKRAGDKIILQLVNGKDNISLEQPEVMKLPLGDIISQLMKSLENAKVIQKPAMSDRLAELIQRVQRLLEGVTVDITKGDLAQQIRDALSKLGYDYEHKLLKTLAEGRARSLEEETGTWLKAELMKLQSIFSRDSLQDRSLQSLLLESINRVLEIIEFQQLRSIAYDDRYEQFYFQIPFFLHDQIATAEIDFFRPKAKMNQDDGSFKVVLSFDLERLGHIEFVINVMDKHIDCRIKANQYETYKLAKEHAGDLENRLKALGYEIVGINCAISNPEGYEAQDHIDMDDIDITV